MSFSHHIETYARLKKEPNVQVSRFESRDETS